MYIPYSDRICNLCCTNSIGDEYHYLTCSNMYGQKLLDSTIYLNTITTNQTFSNYIIISVIKISKYKRI